MSKTLFPAGPVDLEVLDQFLMSEASPENCMQLSDLDGFLTGIAIGPELIVPSEWLPAIWGGDEPVFESIDRTGPERDRHHHGPLQRDPPRTQY